jgi:hypothetical protein
MACSIPSNLLLCLQQSLIELAKWNKEYLRASPGASEAGTCPHAEEVLLLCLHYLEVFYKSKKSCMIGPVVAELSKYISAQLSLRER